MNDYVFVPDPNRKEAEKLVADYHYSGYVPTNVQYIAGVEKDGQLVAAIFYTVPATRWSESVFELARLVRHDDYHPPLTQLIGKSVKELKKRKNANLIVSFADNTQGHHGGVYQAASWNFHEMRKPACDAFVINGELVPRRTCNHRYGTSSWKKLPDMLYLANGDECVPHFDKGKFLYWRALGFSGQQKAKRLGLKTIPYVKPLTEGGGR